MDVAWMAIDSTLSCGYVSEYAVVRLYSPKPMLVLLGPVSAISYDPVKDLNEVTFTGPGNFYLGTDDLSWVWTGEAGSNWHDPANWQMEGHPGIRGVPLAGNNVVIPAGAAHMPVVSSSDQAICHDLSIRPGATLTIDFLKFLTVTGTLTIEEGPPVPGN
jgi:hypothetical protein